MKPYQETLHSLAHYLPHTKEDERWQLYTTTVGTARIRPGGAYPSPSLEHPDTHMFSWPTGRVLREFQFVYIVEGGGRYRSFSGEKVLSPGSMISVFPGERHAYEPDARTGWREYWIGFGGACAEAWLREGIFDAVQPIVHLGVNPSVIATYEEALRIVHRGGEGVQRLVSALIPQLCALITTAKRDVRSSSGASQFLERVRLLFEDNLYTKFDVETITAALHTNYHSLLETFKQHTGMSPYQYFLQMKIDKAKKLLSRGDLSVKEVSLRLAFDNPYYFSRLFKKKTGISPSRWNGAHLNTDMAYWSEDEG